jgi:hypothetical protein
MLLFYADFSADADLLAVFHFTRKINPDDFLGKLKYHPDRL